MNKSLLELKSNGVGFIIGGRLEQQQKEYNIIIIIILNIYILDIFQSHHDYAHPPIKGLTESRMRMIVNPVLKLNYLSVTLFTLFFHHHCVDDGERQVIY